MYKSWSVSRILSNTFLRKQRLPKCFIIDIWCGPRSASQKSDINKTVLDQSAAVNNYIINPFLTNAPTFYPLETPKNLWFSDVFKERGVWNGNIGQKKINDDFDIVGIFDPWIFFAALYSQCSNLARQG